MSVYSYRTNNMLNTAMEMVLNNICVNRQLVKLKHCKETYSPILLQNEVNPLPTCTYVTAGIIIHQCIYRQLICFWYW